MDNKMDIEEFDSFININCSYKEYSQAVNGTGEFGNPLLDLISEVIYAYVILHIEEGAALPDSDEIIEKINIFTEEEPVDLYLYYDVIGKHEMLKSLLEYLVHYERYEEAAEIRDYKESLNES